MDNINIPDIQGIPKRSKSTCYVFADIIPNSQQWHKRNHVYHQVLILFQQTGTKSMYITQFLKLL